MSDAASTALTQAVADLQQAITDEVAEMDSNFAALQAAQAAAGPVTAAEVAATQALQANIQTLRDASARNLPGVPPPSPPAGP